MFHVEKPDMCMRYVIKKSFLSFFLSLDTGSIGADHNNFKILKKNLSAVLFTNLGVPLTPQWSWN